ncbi:phosphoglycerate mutase-like protein [Rhizodiscina lignyota]|uniref:Phosphoglycerate mutase-like protein n=1 Tax=Rhizodiscina lignyota TaxID=1504668 RepID=A0A9P4I6B2_9PEZI|nr:phosphoglycerate mutase-like protein [Rhizodiscina lignyota]
MSYYLVLSLLLNAVTAVELVGDSTGTIPAKFPPYLGGQSPWFPGPNVNHISPEPPEGCSVDMAAFTSRHSSRYPDPGSYEQWVALQSKIQNASFTAHGPLSFISDWKTALRHPDQEISQISIGGYKELYDMGVTYRLRYPDMYSDNQPFYVWANQYQTNQPRVIDSARLFVRGFVGPNATTDGSVYVLNNTDPRGIANSLAPSDICPTYMDTSGGSFATEWANIYLPPIVDRANALTSPKGAVNFTASDVSNFPVLCGYESQITGRTSPWCGTFTEPELKQFEYAQDIRYYYGSGPGALKNDTFMLPFLAAVVQRFMDGPNKTYTSSDGTKFTPPPLIGTFTNDGQINQLASTIGVFDDQAPLPANHIPPRQKYIASRYVTMRGTIGFERLNCKGKQYMRTLLNDAVYPVVGCDSGPGCSCPLNEYAQLVARKQKEAGNFVDVCFGAAAHAAVNGTAKTTFLTDLALPWERKVVP